MKHCIKLCFELTAQTVRFSYSELHVEERTKILALQIVCYFRKYFHLQAELPTVECVLWYTGVKQSVSGVLFVHDKHIMCFSVHHDLQTLGSTWLFNSVTRDANCSYKVWPSCQSVAVLQGFPRFFACDILIWSKSLLINHYKRCEQFKGFKSREVKLSSTETIRD